MTNRIVASITDALEGVEDGSTVPMGGSGAVGQPGALIRGLVEQGAEGLVAPLNDAGAGSVGVARLLELGRVRKVVCPFPRSQGSVVFEEPHRGGRTESEIGPQGTSTERTRAAAAGIPAIYAGRAGLRHARLHQRRRAGRRAGPRLRNAEDGAGRGFRGAPEPRRRAPAPPGPTEKGGRG